MKMFHSSTQARAARAAWLVLAAGALLLLAGCAPGAASAGGTPAATQPSSTSPAISPTATTTYTGSPLPTTTPPAGSAQTGCPAATQDVHWPSPPTLVVTLPQTTPIQVKVGDTLEVALKWNQKWELASQDASILRLDKPAGYGDASLQSCIWHFTALASGQANLGFTGVPMCNKDPNCVPSVRLVHLTVQVNSK